MNRYTLSLSNLEEEEGMNTAHSEAIYQAENGNNLNTDSLWTVEDVAGFLKLQPETIRSMARRGELPAFKFGKVWRFQSTTIHNMFITNTRS